jgi:hypothetical protein
MSWTTRDGLKPKHGIKVECSLMEWSSVGKRIGLPQAQRQEWGGWAGLFRAI